MKVLIAGYPYVRESFLKTFDHLENEVIFLLPKKWKAKGGKVVFTPPVRFNVETVSAVFYHSHYPVIGGIFKGWMPAFPLVLWRHCKEVKAVYTPMEPILLSTLYQGFWAKLFRKKHFIFTWENVPYEKFQGFNGVLKKIILRLNLSLCDGVICGNKKAEEIIRHYTRKPTAVIPLSGVDIDFFSPALRDRSLVQEYSLEGKTVFSFIGALGYRKGIHLILEAFREVIKTHPEIHLIIAGSGEYKETLEQQIHALNLKESVSMIPWADMSLVRKILSITDIFLYPSLPHAGWEEQFGYSIAEAMAMEVPVISTDSGSISDLINSDKNGILIQPKNVSKLENSMQLLLAESDLRERLARAARQTIVDRFSYRRVADLYHKFFTLDGS